MLSLYSLGLSALAVISVVGGSLGNVPLAGSMGTIGSFNNSMSLASRGASQSLTSPSVLSVNLMTQDPIFGDVIDTAFVQMISSIGS
jgi:hypothetical protein